MTLSDPQLETYRDIGHLTVPGVFTAIEMDAAIADAQAWADEVLAAMSEQDRAWYLDHGAGDGRMLRKLDNPVAHRPVFRELAAKPALVDMVRYLIGGGLRVSFSQIFFKPPGGGGPKPVHQDNFYFGPNNRDGLVTAWVALDDADLENGCLYFGDGSNLGPVLEHVAPADRPFDLQVPPGIAAHHPMSPAPVPRGGVSFHHGNTLHQSSDNRSDRWRRACAIHYVSAGTVFETPALTYDPALMVAVG